MEFEILQRIIAEAMNYDPDDITEDTKFVDDLGADSLDIFQIILAIEDEFEISISDNQVESIVTVGDAAEEIKKAVDEQ